MKGKFEGGMFLSNLFDSYTWEMYENQDYFYFRPYFVGSDIESYFVYTLDDNLLIARFDTFEDLYSFVRSHV